MWGTGFTPILLPSPPSRGKGFVGAERAIFIVMTIGGAALCCVWDDMLVGSTGMGPRMREDNGGEGAHEGLFQKSPRVCPRQKGVTTGVTISTNAAIYD